MLLFFILQERENFNNAVAENTERHLTSLCQTLTNQLEDVREQLRLSEERYKRIDNELLAKNDKYEAIKYNIYAETIFCYS